jgi:hypothetical protein
MAKAARVPDQVCVVIRSAGKHGSLPSWLEIICSKRMVKAAEPVELIAAHPLILFAVRPELLKPNGHVEQSGY